MIEHANRTGKMIFDVHWAYKACCIRILTIKRLNNTPCVWQTLEMTLLALAEIIFKIIIKIQQNKNEKESAP